MFLFSGLYSGQRYDRCLCGAGIQGLLRTGKRDAYNSSKRNYFDEVGKNSRKYSKENYILSVHVNELERALGEIKI